MNEFLFKKFIKDHGDVSDPRVRDAYGRLAGIVGIISNTALCVFKVTAGRLAGSVSVLADGLNSLTDASSSLITLAGFRLAAMPEDKEHPYGHARMEYLTGMAVSVIILLMGLELLKSSVDRILHPSPSVFSLLTVAALTVSMAVKLWQSSFNFAAGKKIDSLALRAAGTDGRNDVLTSAAVLAGVLVEKFTGIKTDGWIGAGVALFIMWSGVSLIRTTVSPLLGEAPDPGIIKRIKELSRMDGILGIHDLQVHNYGPGKVFASLHAEVDASEDVMKSHDVIDNLEHAIARELNINATVHMDPVDLSAPHRDRVIALLRQTIDSMDGVEDIHDLRMVPGPTHTNVIFDLVLSPDCGLSREEIRSRIDAALKSEYPGFFPVIEFDKAYGTWV